MKIKTASGSQNEKKLIILGFISIVVLFIIYARFENPGITPDAISSIERLSVAFYILLVIAFGTIGLGLRRYQRKSAATGNQTAISMICNSTISKNSMKVFIITFVIYGFFFFRWTDGWCRKSFGKRRQDFSCKRQQHFCRWNT